MHYNFLGGKNGSVLFLQSSHILFYLLYIIYSRSGVFTVLLFSRNSCKMFTTEHIDGMRRLFSIQFSLLSQKKAVHKLSKV